MKLLAQNNINLNTGARGANLPGSNIANEQSRFGSFFGGLMGAIMVVAAILALMYLLWGGLEWITSGGDKSKVETARNKITQAIVGLIVLAAATAIFVLLQQFLGICVLNFGGSC